MGEGTVFSLFVSSHPGGGYPIPIHPCMGGGTRSSLGQGGGTPIQPWMGGYSRTSLGQVGWGPQPWTGGYPNLEWGGTPILDGGYPNLGGGIPSPGGGTPSLGVPHPMSRYPPWNSKHLLTATRRAVCLLRSPQEDFLVLCVISNNTKAHDKPVPTEKENPSLCS